MCSSTKIRSALRSGNRKKEIACSNPKKRVYCNWMLLYVLPIILITRRLDRTTECDKLKIHSGNDHEEAYLAWDRCTNFPCHAARAAHDQRVDRAGYTTTPPRATPRNPCPQR